MFQIKNNILCFVVVCVTFVSCTTSKQIVYMNDLKKDSSNFSSLLKAKVNFENKIQKNDLLWITVGGSNILDLPPINSGMGIPAGGAGVLGQAGGSSIGFLVESDGSIKIPYLGKIQAEGLSRVQLEEKLFVELKEYTKDPVVNVRFMNYKVTVMGEVQRPGTINLPTERITILEAIGMAGDLTILGQRSEVLIIREQNGVREIGRLNLLSKNLLLSPFYYLQNNDLVYVEPAPAKFFARERIPQFLTLAASSLSLLLTIVTLTKL